MHLPSISSALASVETLGQDILHLLLNIPEIQTVAATAIAARTGLPEPVVASLLGTLAGSVPAPAPGSAAVVPTAESAQ
jgi:hypothetical protein